MVVRAILVLLLVPAGAAAQPGELLQRLVESGRHPAIHWSRFADVQADARRLYAENEWAPLWLLEHRVTGNGRVLLDALATSADRGLVPADYDAVQLGALAATLERGGGDAEQAARFDAALTIAGLRVVRALARGRVPPRAGAPYDAAAELAAFRAAEDPAPRLAALEPPWPYYHALRRALARYRALERDTALRRLPRPNGALAAGARYAGAAQLRALLAAFGDLSPDATAPRAVDTLLAPELIEGLYRFQIRQGARVTGLLNEASWRLLTAPLGPRIRQMALALERWRWLPRDTAASPLFVALPAGRAHYLAGGPAGGISINLNALASPALMAAHPAERQWLTTIVFRPPESPASVLFQGEEPGGLVLHGSSPYDLGSRPRAGSLRNGIWIADAQLLAELLLRDRPEWTAGRVHSAMAGGPGMVVQLPHPIPLLAVYGTAVARENGQVFFYGDPVGLDRRLELQLGTVYR
jgi:murein L,D-transpeptidase YcbB/YkuD